ncbi:MAG: M28 family peptidase [Myxococcales bacterium]|nr:M28 family peptidase [Myxococcales bacterium]
MTDAWERIEAEARGAYEGAGRFPLRAYSELMPPPYIGLKPCAPVRGRGLATLEVTEGDALDVDEYEQAHDLEPGLDRIAAVIVAELGKLMHGKPHALSRTLLEGNPAWPPELAAAARDNRLAHDPLVVICPLALSRSQDDKGNDRWTLFGASHDGAAAPTLHGLDDSALGDVIAWAGLDPDWRILAAASDVPAPLVPRLLDETRLAEVKTLVTFVPFAQLPDAIRAAYLAGSLVLVPSPATLVLFEHPRYRELSRELPRAMQIPLLHLFPRVEGSCAIRIPQSGWIDEGAPAAAHGHRVVPHLVRTHRWQRDARDADHLAEGAYADKVAVALFSTTPEAIDLYNKPLARNSQVWTEDYHLLLDGPAAESAAILHAASVVDEGGRFGYRMYYPPMRAGLREVFWHLPLIARRGAGRLADGPLGYATAELPGAAPILLVPRLLSRPAHVAAARAFPFDPGHARYTLAHNLRKLLATSDQLGGPLTAEHARALLHVEKHVTLEAWLAELPGQAADPAVGQQVLTAVRACLGATTATSAPHVLGSLGTRAFEEQVWRSISQLSHGELRQKNDADGISVNRGKHGGPAAKAAHIHAHERRDLEALGDHLHDRYRALIEAHGMTGKAEVVDHVFRWETDFAFPWMEGWAKNQLAPAERNIVLVIPGRDRTQAVVMGDHYDTAYMEDVYYKESGGDLLRAPAAGADDNHSATTALLLAAEQLLPLARAGRLERDVWLVHLTGEEYPADCMGARALAQGLVERHLVFTAEDGRPRDVSNVTVVGAFILDMIGHNTERSRDVFQIAPGEGAASARLALRAHRANLAWNRLVTEWNQAPGRAGLVRAERMPDGATPSPPPPPFAHLVVHGEVRVEWEPRSALFNTDGQIFSDLGIPTVLFMENYDISRKGYHDTHDTMANIDLDYCAALTAIAIETVVDTACVRDDDIAVVSGMQPATSTTQLASARAS